MLHYILILTIFLFIILKVILNQFWSFQFLLYCLFIYCFYVFYFFIIRFFLIVFNNQKPQGQLFNLPFKTSTLAKLPALTEYRKSSSLSTQRSYVVSPVTSTVTPGQNQVGLATCWTTVFTQTVLTMLIWYEGVHSVLRKYHPHHQMTSSLNKARIIDAFMCFTPNSDPTI